MAPTWRLFDDIFMAGVQYHGRASFGKYSGQKVRRRTDNYARSTESAELQSIHDYSVQTIWDRNAGGRSSNSTHRVAPIQNGRRILRSNDDDVNRSRKRRRTSSAVAGAGSADDRYVVNMQSIQTEMIRNILHSDNMSKGEKRLRDFVGRFSNGFRMKKKPCVPEKFQLGFVNLMSQVLAPNIVGAEWNVIGPRLCKEFGWETGKEQKLVLAQAPRRFGKTVAIAMAMLNLAMTKAQSVQSAFSTSKRASQNLKNCVMKLLKDSGYGDLIVVCGDEKLFIRTLYPEDGGAISEMNFYPNNKTIGSLISLFHSVCLSLSLSLSRYNRGHSCRRPGYIHTHTHASPPVPSPSQATHSRIRLGLFFFIKFSIRSVGDGPDWFVVGSCSTGP